jgi:hypothetical protein
VYRLIRLLTCGSRRSFKNRRHKSDGAGNSNLKLGSEGAADTGKQGFKVGRKDEGIIQSSFLKLQYCKPDPVIPLELGSKAQGSP